MPSIKVQIPLPYQVAANAVNTQNSLLIYFRDLEYSLRNLESSINALTTSDIPEGSNLYYTDARARAAISAVAPITYNPSTGVIDSNSTSANTFNYLVRRDGVTGGFAAGAISCAAGSAAAGTAPIKFTSGSLMTTAEAGAVEFLTDKAYLTITTAAARKEFTLNDAALTSGRVPFTTTNGRLSDNSNFTWDNTNRTLGISTASTSTSCAEFTKTEHASTLQSAFRLKDSTGQEVVGFTGWNGGGGTGGYGSIVVSSTGGSAVRLGEIGGKNNTNGFRICDFIFQTGTAADLGEIVTLLGAGSGSFAYAQYIGANGTAFKISSAPTAKVHIAAGSTAASSAPIKLTSGSYMTTPEAGTFEWNSSTAENPTFTPSATRYRIPLIDSGVGGLTSGRVPFATTNGRLTDASGLTFAGSTLTVNTLALTNPLTETNGGTGESAYTLGDVLYSDATNSLARLAGNTTTTKKFLRQTGNGSISAAPAWDTLVDGDIPATLSANARVMVRKGTGSDVGPRRRLSLIEGTNMTLTVADDSVNEEVDVTIASAGPHVLLCFQVSALSPADSTTYYIGSAPTNALTSTFTDQRLYVPKSGTLKSVFVRVRVGGTLGSGESVTHAIRINDTTDVSLNSMTYAAATQSDVTTGLSQAVSAGDYVVLKLVTPAWATNPTTVTWMAQLFIE